jgi:hypothetical protein
MEFNTKLEKQIPGSVSEQLKADPSPQIATPDPINTGIAATHDAFEIPTPNNRFLGILTAITEPPKTQATSGDNKVAQLKERLKSLQDQVNELNIQMKALEDEIVAAQQARDIPHLKSAQAKLNELSSKLKNIQEEMQSIMKQLEFFDQNEEHPRDSENSKNESLLIQDSTSLKEYFWNRLNRELLNAPHSFITPKAEDDK